MFQCALCVFYCMLRSYLFILFCPFTTKYISFRLYLHFIAPIDCSNGFKLSIIISYIVLKGFFFMPLAVCAVYDVYDVCAMSALQEV